MGNLVLKGRRILLDGRFIEASLLVRDGKIAAIERSSAAPLRQAQGERHGGTEVVDAGDRAVLPGLVDCHAHLNEPGRTEWEGFATGTAAAAAGGITALVDMPLNSIPATTTLEALRVKAGHARGQCRVDYAFWGGVVPGNAGELEAMVDEGVVGFKCFLCPSGVDEFSHVARADLEKAMPILARRGVPLIVHAELEDERIPAWGDPRKYASYLASRPTRFENRAIQMMIELCRATGCRVHIVHLSSAEALEDIHQARKEGLPFSAETCPHYLTFAAEEIPDGATAYKCAPPIREAANRERLWRALKDGDISVVVSDHSPCTPNLKKLEAGDFHEAWGGIASLQLGLRSIWTGARARGIGLERLGEWMSRAPAALVGLSERKGELAVGRDADFVVFDPDATQSVDPATLRHRHRVTPYAGRTLRGRIEKTFLRGTCIHDGRELAQPPQGELLRRPARVGKAA